MTNTALQDSNMDVRRTQLPPSEKYVGLNISIESPYKVSKTFQYHNLMHNNGYTVLNRTRVLCGLSRTQS